MCRRRRNNYTENLRTGGAAKVAGWEGRPPGSFRPGTTRGVLSDHLKRCAPADPLTAGVARATIAPEVTSIRLFLPLIAAVVLASTAPHVPAAMSAAGLSQVDRRVVAPVFKVDPFWPKALPNHWILGSTIGLAVDARNHVFVLHRQSSIDVEFKAAALNPPLGACCVPAPPVLEFGPDGTLVNSWGGPGQGYDWPLREHGLSIDHKGNVWIGGNDDKDSQILKFTSVGRFVLQIGRPGQKKGSNDRENFWRPAKVFVEPLANEAYIADGYGNRRVIVVDADSGRPSVTGAHMALRPTTR